MRLDIVFPRPLSRADRLAVLLAVAGLAKSDRVRFVRGDWQAVITGEGLAIASVRDALAEAGLAVESIATSLDEGEDRLLDDRADVAGPERVRPLGRGSA